MDEMIEIDPCHYELKGFYMTYDGEYGTWTIYDPSGEYLQTVTDALDEVMICLSQWADQ